MIDTLVPEPTKDSNRWNKIKEIIKNTHERNRDAT